MTGSRQIEGLLGLDPGADITLLFKAVTQPRSFNATDLFTICYAGSDDGCSFDLLN